MRSMLIAAALAGDRRRLGDPAAAAAADRRKGPRADGADRAPVSGARMKATSRNWSSFGTRHTLSSQTDPKRGIGAAVRWAEARDEEARARDAADLRHRHRPPRAEPDPVCNAVAIQRGTERPNDVVIITGHIDSRVSDPMDFTKDAPGANDDGSGTAAVIEAARVLSKHKFPGTIVYAALSGEEQGLLGRQDPRRLRQGAGLERRRQSQQRHHRQQLRLRRGVQRQAGAGLLRRPALAGARGACAAQQRSLGGENDSPSRNLSRFLDSSGRAAAGDRPRRPADLAQRPLRPRRRPYRIPQRRLPRGALLGRGRGLRPPAPGFAGRERASTSIGDTDRRDGLCLSREGDQAQRRRARLRSPAPRRRPSRRSKGR